MNANSSDNDVLFTFTVWARRWAKEKKLDLNIRPLTLATLSKDKSGIGYPELSSRIKASRARVLLAYCSLVAVEIDPWSHICLLYCLFIWIWDIFEKCR